MKQKLPRKSLLQTLHEQAKSQELVPVEIKVWGGRLCHFLDHIVCHNFHSDDLHTHNSDQNLSVEQTLHEQPKSQELVPVEIKVWGDRLCHFLDHIVCHNFHSNDPTHL
jgi:hypothetical protein